MKSESEIREELKRVQQDAKNRDFTEGFRANAFVMAVMLEWVLDEEEGDDSVPWDEAICATYAEEK